MESGSSRGRTLLQFGINKKDGRLELIILVFTGRSTPPSLLRFLPGWLTCFPLNRLEARLSLSFHFCFHFSASRVPRHCLPTTPLTTSTRFSNIRISRTCIKLHEKFSFSFFLSPSSLFHFSLFLETRFKFELIQGCIRISVKGRVWLSVYLDETLSSIRTLLRERNSSFLVKIK